MNIRLLEFEEYVEQKLNGGGYGSAADVVREALRKMRDSEIEEAIEARIEFYVLKGIDQGPPDGVSSEDWDKRLRLVRERMNRFIGEGLEAAERGEVLSPSESRSASRKRRESRSASKSKRSA